MFVLSTHCSVLPIPSYNVAIDGDDPVCLPRLGLLRLSRRVFLAGILSIPLLSFLCVSQNLDPLRSA